MKARKQHTFDAIVVGSGISGGWAAKELCEQGLKTLVLERGRNVTHIEDYPTANWFPWELPHRGMLATAEHNSYPIQRKCYAFGEDTKHFFVRDEEHPYTQIKGFDWIRGYQVGGKSLLWARQCYRLSPMDFEANARDGVGVDWPIRYEDLAPWYDYVERFAGISGNRDGLPQIPDGVFLPPMQMTCVEMHFAEFLARHFEHRRMIIGRCANLTQSHLGRGPCQYRNLCHRGCPYSGYFSSNSATLPAAQKTGNLTLLPHSIVHSVIYDEQKGKATGVRVIDAHTKQMTEYYARIIFLNASTLNTTLIMLNSTSHRFPNGLGNDSGQLGHNLMDHNYRVRIYAEIDGYENRYYTGRRPNGTYIPRYQNLQKNDRPYLRGFAYGGGSWREGWARGIYQSGFGDEWKQKLSQPGKWHFAMHAMGEMLPDYSNQVLLDTSRLDKWGMPTLKIDCEYKENELLMIKDMMTDAVEMLEAAGFKNVRAEDSQQFPGLGIHEMGTARMGRDPKTSVLNKHNQVWAVPNVFVTDGACMTSSACQNPSLTYMALTARACHFAVSEMKRGNL
ncbi:MAG: GMC family oxidoreductase [Cytophagales bacterium]|nr:GMC family oxidoreductase [Bernardetiaceae bacterium]MDW8203399.1 GMC family oxidoreductase [Cytophagales bacterium]